MIWLAGWPSISRSSPELLPAQSLPKSQDRHEGFVDAPLLFWGECPTSPTSRPASTAPTCSTSTRAVSPSRSISGRKEAALALSDVGATGTTDRGYVGL